MSTLEMEMYIQQEREDYEDEFEQRIEDREQRFEREIEEMTQAFERNLELLTEDHALGCNLWHRPLVPSKAHIHDS